MRGTVVTFRLEPRYRDSIITIASNFRISKVEFLRILLDDLFSQLPSNSILENLQPVDKDVAKARGLILKALKERGGPE